MKHKATVYLILAVFVITGLFSCTAGDKTQGDEPVSKTGIQASFFLDKGRYALDDFSAEFNLPLKDTGVLNKCFWYKLCFNGNNQINVVPVQSPKQFVYEKKTLLEGTTGIDFGPHCNSGETFFLATENDTEVAEQIPCFSTPLDSLLLLRQVSFIFNGKTYKVNVAFRKDTIAENKINVLETYLVLENFRLTLTSGSGTQLIHSCDTLIMSSDFTRINKVIFCDLNKDQEPDIITPVHKVKNRTVTTLFTSGRQYSLPTHFSTGSSTNSPH